MPYYTTTSEIVTPINDSYELAPSKEQYANVISNLGDANTDDLINYLDFFNEIIDPKKEDGLTFCKDNKRIGIQKAHSNGDYYITEFIPIVLQVIEMIGLEDTSYQMEIILICHKCPTRQIRVYSEDIGKSQWIERAGYEYIYSDSAIKEIRKILKRLALYAPKAVEYLFSGWSVNKPSIYIIGGNPINTMIRSDADTKNACNHTIDMLETAPYRITIPMLSAALLSLIHSKMIEQNNHFKGIICLVAPTQSFKTTLSSLFFDFKNGSKVDISFEDTQASIDRVINAGRDKITVLDDLKPGASRLENKEMNAKLSRIARMCSDDSGGIKKASNKNNVISNISRGIVYVTAEQIGIEIQSTLARILVIEMSKNDADKGKITYYQEHHSIYRDFIFDYIRWICSMDIDKYCTEMNDNFIRNRDIIRSNLLQHSISVDNRTSDMCVWLYISFCKFLEYAQTVDVIDENISSELKNQGFEIYQSILEQQAQRVNDLDGLTLYFKALKIILDIKEAKICVLQNNTNSDYYATDDSNVLGFEKADFVYIKKDIAIQRVHAYYNSMNKEFPFTESNIRKMLKDRCYLYNRQNYRNNGIYRLSVSGKSYQCLEFSKNVFYKLLGGDNYEHKREEQIPSDRSIQQDAAYFTGR